ncbi:16S rRNA (uracil(1498)-N(3))-methyltransferase [Gracilibacillus marinus]|jgi:16S rRNA (uracil1498-N3)-methyltransferase|uniref:Ribosomal RNA small subunit methyltransferase E n=1 Tax=Gracilibacillus marinus TaxID=630535 RepID=A0ABV8W069_9BACI
MQRYFVSADNWMEDEVHIVGEDVHHIVHVMRMDNGSEILCNHPNGNVCKAVIKEATNEKVVAKIQTYLDVKTDSPVHATIVQGLPKGDKWETILQKATELGVSEFIPFQAERSIVKWDKQKVAKKIERWHKIVKEASEQSHRNTIPIVNKVLELKEVITRYKDVKHKFFAYEDTAKTNHQTKLHDHFQSIHEGDSVMICIGPEGGFSNSEATFLIENDFQPIRLGPRILRTETAPLYVLSCLSYYLEEMR